MKEWKSTLVKNVQIQVSSSACRHLFTARVESKSVVQPGAVAELVMSTQEERAAETEPFLYLLVPIPSDAKHSQPLLKPRQLRGRTHLSFSNSRKYTDPPPG